MPALLGHPFRVFTATLKTVALAHVFWAYGWNVAPGRGPSMLPTFQFTGEWFVVNRGFRRGRGVQVGDVIQYAIPVEHNEGGVKRVTGMPGDYVLLNSPPGADEDGDEDGGVGSLYGAAGRRMIQVPQGHCYIVGDNLPWSRDSRDFGPVPLALLKGKVTHVCKIDSWWPGNWFIPVKNGLSPI